MHALSIAALVVTSVAVLVALAGVVLPKWRAQPRNVYYSTPKVVALIVVLGASAGALFATGESLLGWVAAVAGGWVLLEGLWALVKSRTDLFSELDEPAKEPVEEPAIEAVVPEPAPVTRRTNPTPRGPVRQHRRR